jgi:hypothetical protein
VSSCRWSSNALATTSGATPTAPPKIGVSDMRFKSRPVASSPGKSRSLPNDMHCTSCVSWCLENDRSSLGSLRNTTFHPRLATFGAKETCLMWRGKTNDCRVWDQSLKVYGSEIVIIALSSGAISSPVCNHPIAIMDHHLKFSIVH